MLPRILIVEDETVLRSAMARALAKLPAQIDAAATVAEAVAHLDRAIPDVIISDLDLPDGPGIELIGELGRRKARVPVGFVSAYLRAYRAQIPPHADVEVRETIELDELRALVRDRLRPRDDDSAPFGVTDYIQLACLGKHSVVIEVTHHGQARGRLEVVDGEIPSARASPSSPLPHGTWCTGHTISLWRRPSAGRPAGSRQPTAGRPPTSLG